MCTILLVLLVFFVFYQAFLAIFFLSFADMSSFVNVLVWYELYFGLYFLF